MVCLFLHRVEGTPLEDAGVGWVVRSVTLTVETATDKSFVVIYAL